MIRGSKLIYVGAYNPNSRKIGSLLAEQSISWSEPFIGRVDRALIETVDSGLSPHHTKHYELVCRYVY